MSKYNLKPFLAASWGPVKYELSLIKNAYRPGL